MKKINSVIVEESLPEKAGASRKLTQAEMEYELDHCPAPWQCPEACYKALGSCIQEDGRERLTVRARLRRE